MWPQTGRRIEEWPRSSDAVPVTPAPPVTGAGGPEVIVRVLKKDPYSWKWTHNKRLDGRFHQCTCEAAAVDPVVEVVVGEMCDVLHGPNLISALVTEVITLQRLTECGAKIAQKEKSDQEVKNHPGGVWQQWECIAMSLVINWNIVLEFSLTPPAPVFPWRNASWLSCNKVYCPGWGPPHVWWNRCPDHFSSNVATRKVFNAHKWTSSDSRPVKSSCSNTCEILLLLSFYTHLLINDAWTK